MQYRLSLRALLVMSIGIALVAMTTAYGLQNQQHEMVWRFMLAALTPVVIFGLLVFFYVITLPIGLLGSVYQQAQESPTSPFSADRLPERVVHSNDTSAS